MVYCGKPSKGCSNCRSRKISCDQREPGCLQCEKRKLSCSGYRNLVDLMFRDESSHVIEKANARTRRKAVIRPSSGSMPYLAQPKISQVVHHTSNPTHPSHSNTSGSTSGDAVRDVLLRETTLLTSSNKQASASWPHSPKVAVLHNPSPIFQDLGLAFFFSRYVSSEETVAYTRFDFVHHVWRPNSLVLERQKDGVLAGMTALGLAGLSNLTKSTMMMDIARQSYAIALQKTNVALRNPQDAAKDSTLLTILILNVFETMTGYSPQTLRAWTEHVKGAVALAQMRGKKQFKTDAGMRMFLLLTQSVMISCTTREHPMPQSMIDLRAEAGRYLPQNEPSWRITGAVYKLLQVRFDIKERNLTDPFEIIKKLSAIDDEFDAITKEFPASWQPQILNIGHEHPAAYRGVCHLYPTQWHTKTWNGLRASRTIIHEIIRGKILEGLKSPSPKIVPEKLVKMFHNSCELLARLRDATIASVPQHFGVAKYDVEAGDATVYIPWYGLVQDAEDTRASAPAAGWSSSSNSGKPAASPGRIFTAYQGSTSALPPAPTDPETRRFLLLVSASNMLIWPLYITGMSSACTPEIRTYISTNLRALANETGIIQAKHLANIVERSGTNMAPASDVPLSIVRGAGADESLASAAREFRAFPVQV